MAELLSVPFKKSVDVDIVKPLKNLIQSTYNTEDYSEALAELSRLRSNAIWKIFDKSPLDVIYSYYDQLVSLESKLPPQEVQIPFKWKDAFDKGSLFAGRLSLTISSLAYERVCIQFNIAALQSAHAAAETLDTEESLKLAAKLFQQAAGVFASLKAEAAAAVQTEPTPDLAPDALHALSALMLAQAQELIAYKCIRDGMKESMAAKVCGGAAELYGEAARALQRDHLRHLWDKEWLVTVSNKQQWFTGLAHMYVATQCGAAGARGEEIARLQLAAGLLVGAARHPVLQESVRRLSSRLTGAVRDNDFIYHERVPPPAELSPPPRAAVAVAAVPPRKYTSHPDLFGSLAPAAVHRALSASEARRSELVNAEINKLREGTQLLNSILASLNLPACVEGGGGGGAGGAAAGGLPESIRAKAAAVRGQGGAGGLPALRRLMSELPDLLQRNRDILDECDRLLAEEAAADATLRAQFGARWSRTASASLTTSLRASAGKYRQIIDNAVQADAIVQEKFNTHKESMELLCRSESEIAAAVPAAAAGAGGSAGVGGDEVVALRALMGEVEQLKASRDALESSLKEVRLDLKEEFLAALSSSEGTGGAGTGGAGLDEPARTHAALSQALQPLSQRVASSLDRQAALLARIQESHTALMRSRGEVAGSGSGAGAGAGAGEGRDAALSRLCSAHDAYQELTNNLQEGVKFYNDLTQLLVAFQNKVSDFCFARRTEKEELLKDLTQEASRGPSRPAPTPPQHHASAGPSPAPSPAPGPAPLPYPAQPQGMPLPYAAPYYYAAPPMPVSYNPYATLPYPHHARGPPPAPAYQPYQYPAPAPGPGSAPAPGAYQAPPGQYNPYQQ